MRSGSRASDKAQDAVPFIPDRCTTRVPHAFRRDLDRLRNGIVRFFNDLKQFRPNATRYDQPAASYLAMVTIATVRIWLGVDGSTPGLIEVAKLLKMAHAEMFSSGSIRVTDGCSGWFSNSSSIAGLPIDRTSDSVT